MGILSKILGGGKEYPDLDAGHPSAERIRQTRPLLQELAGEIDDSLEVVPTDSGVYIFAGKPPTKFGMFWIRGDRVHNFKTLSKERGLSSLDLQPVVEKLQSAYREHSSEERYSADLSGRKITVTPSDGLGRKVEEIIQTVSS